MSQFLKYISVDVDDAGCLSIKGISTGVPGLNTGRSTTICSDTITECSTWQVGPLNGKHCVSSSRNKGKKH